MSKTALLFLLVIQITTKPRLETFEDWTRELVVFIVAVSLGSLLRVAMKFKSRKKVDRMDAMLILFFGISLGAVANYLMIYFKLDWPRPFIVWAVSLMGEFIVMWLEKRNVKILDKLFQKGTGIDVSDKKQVPEEENYEE